MLLYPVYLYIICVCFALTTMICSHEPIIYILWQIYSVFTWQRESEIAFVRIMLLAFNQCKHRIFPKII